MDIPKSINYDKIKSNLHLVEMALWILVFLFSVLIIIIT